MKSVDAAPVDVVLYRPVGTAELELIQQSGWREFPPRLPEQPIFYPVVLREYATQIARDWNARNGASGYVVQFAVDAAYLSRYVVQTVGARLHQEYWIPAEELAEFNRHIRGTIELVETHGPNQEP